MRILDFADGFESATEPTLIPFPASSVSNTPSGSMSATNVQGAINELQTDVDTRATASDLTTHTSNTSNPHSVTKSQIGLSNADNTSDINKPVSTAQQIALDGKVGLSTLTTKGDIYVATGPGTLSRVPVGANGSVLTADSSQSTGVKYDTAPSSPVGSVTMFAGSSAPSGWLLCDGSAISRTTYAALFSIISTTYGAGDGSTTFNLPNTQGVFVRGAGSQTISSINYSGTLAVKQTDQLQGHKHSLSYPSGFDNTSLFRAGGTGGTHSISTGTNSGAGSLSVGDPNTDGTNGTPRTGSETRPANISLNYIIKT